MRVKLNRPRLKRAIVEYGDALGGDIPPQYKDDMLFDIEHILHLYNLLPKKKKKCLKQMDLAL